ncbi:stalk domain-containing protein [Paenibacillus sp. 32352]|uniref:stalk domain-containing protein n=1 Tax=Paenibacillus sp. 32352 TaxID=1969111 RepID=UPI0015C46530|nr:stalk domain-containing protein [Paenibacillus sp. 32352]
MKLNSTVWNKSTLLCGTVLAGVLIFGTCNTASAETPVSVEIDGKVQTFSQPAVIKDGSTLVPLRGIFEVLGAEIEWNGEQQQVAAQKGAQLIELTINKPTASINGETVTLAANAEIINGSTMVPLRFVAEALGADVSFNPNQNKVSITSFKTESTLEQKVNGIYASIVDPSMTDFQKIYIFNKYLANHVTYDFDNFMNNTIPKVSYTPEGALIKGVAVCQGYAEAMKLLLDKAGIENKIIIGEANGPKGWEGHAWNLVKLNGEYYHVDSTWNDRDLKRTKSNDTTPAPFGDVNLYYFLASDKNMLGDHRFQTDKYPKSGVKFDQLSLNTIPIAETKDKIIIQKPNGDFTVKLIVMDKDGNDISGTLSQEKVHGFLNEIVIGNNLYFTVERPTGEQTLEIELYRVSLDSKDKTFIAKSTDGFEKVIGDYVYFNSTWYDPAHKLPSKSSIHRVLLSTGEDKVLLDDALLLSISNDYIYYLDYRSGGTDIHRVTLEGASDTVIAKNIDFGNYLFSNNYLFYVEALDYKVSFENRKSRVHSVQLEGLKDSLLFEDKQVTFFGFSDGVLTYRAGTQTKTFKVGS